jgi:hypothetical protein
VRQSAQHTRRMHVLWRVLVLGNGLLQRGKYGRMQYPSNGVSHPSSRIGHVPANPLADLGDDMLHRIVTSRCGGAVGMYIDLKRWTTVYLYAGSGSFGPMPFLDCHGELDQGMR